MWTAIASADTRRLRVSLNARSINACDPSVASPATPEPAVEAIAEHRLRVRSVVDRAEMEPPEEVTGRAMSRGPTPEIVRYPVLGEPRIEHVRDHVTLDRRPVVDELHHLGVVVEEHEVVQVAQREPAENDPFGRRDCSGLALAGEGAGAVHRQPSTVNLPCMPT